MRFVILVVWERRVHPPNVSKKEGSTDGGTGVQRCPFEIKVC